MSLITCFGEVIPYQPIIMRVLILFALVASALATPRQSNRIVGGEDTTIDTHPYMSSLQFLWWGMWTPWCGGSLMTSRSILTAAHCIDNTRPNQWRVRVGSTLASRGGQILNLQTLISHENYDPSTEANDVGVIILSSAAALSNNVAIARIPVAGFVLPDGTDVVAVGWGALRQGGPSPDILQHVTVNIINYALCKQRYDARKAEVEATGRPYPFVVDEGMVCTGILNVGGKDACGGDSGGPVSLRQPDVDIVYGITSWGEGCAHPVFPGVNARVSYYTDWIVRNASV